MPVAASRRRCSQQRHMQQHAKRLPGRSTTRCTTSQTSRSRCGHTWAATAHEGIPRVNRRRAPATSRFSRRRFRRGRVEECPYRTTQNRLSRLAASLLRDPGISTGAAATSTASSSGLGLSPCAFRSRARFLRGAAPRTPSARSAPLRAQDPSSNGESGRYRCQQRAGTSALWCSPARRLLA